METRGDALRFRQRAIQCVPARKTVYCPRNVRAVPVMCEPARTCCTPRACRRGASARAQGHPSQLGQVWLGVHLRRPDCAEARGADGGLPEFDGIARSRPGRSLPGRSADEPERECTLPNGNAGITRCSVGFVRHASPPDHRRLEPPGTVYYFPFLWEPPGTVYYLEPQGTVYYFPFLCPGIPESCAESLNR